MAFAVQRVRQQQKASFVSRVKRHPNFQVGDYVYIDKPPNIKESKNVDDPSQKPSSKNVWFTFGENDFLNTAHLAKTGLTVSSRWIDCASLVVMEK